MKEIRKIFEIESNRRVSSRTWSLELKGDTRLLTKPGQFVNILIPGKYLRRPISVSQYFTRERKLRLLYNINGEGTEILSFMKPGELLDLLVGLGNGFTIPDEIRHPLLLGGGIGAAPLMQLAVDLVENGKMPQVVLGYNNAEEGWGMEQDLRNIGISAYTSTIDGSAGTKGFVTDAIREFKINYDYFYACGPMPMLKSLSNLEPQGQLSLECRMGCGFGACMCCSMETKSGVKRICKEGPVFLKSELIWK